MRQENSSICSIFIRRGGSIACRVTGHRQYSSDLPQGGLELPCILTFTTASAKEYSKTKKVFEYTLSIGTREAKSVDKSVEYRPSEQLTLPCQGSSMAIKEDSEDEEMTVEPVCSIDLTNFGEDENVQSPKKKRSKVIDTEGIIMDKELSNDEIYFAQHLLKLQFTKLSGLDSTLLQHKQRKLIENGTKNKIQIIHCNSRHHWIVATTLGCELNQVKVYDSVYTYCDMETEAIISNLFQYNAEKPVITISQSQKQKGNVDCGLFAMLRTPQQIN